VGHARIFRAGIAGLGAWIPIARRSVGAWAGPVAIGLCLMTGYLYGSLFFTPIDVPFLAAMCGATCGILLMARGETPSWPATIAAGGGDRGAGGDPPRPRGLHPRTHPRRT